MQCRGEVSDKVCNYCVYDNFKWHLNLFTFMVSSGGSWNWWFLARSPKLLHHWVDLFWWRLGCAITEKVWFDCSRYNSRKHKSYAYLWISLRLERLVSIQSFSFFAVCPRVSYFFFAFAATHSTKIEWIFLLLDVAVIVPERYDIHNHKKCF